MANIADILGARLGDIKDIPMLPVGTYAATITSIPRVDNFGQKQTPGAEFSFKLTAPQDDVDHELLAEAGGIPEEPLRSTFWLSPKALPVLRAFLVDVLGFSGDESIKEVLPQVVGMEVLVTIEHKASYKDKTKTFAQIAGFAKV